ncbi:Rapamycin-insensitive companion of mTOR, N-term-domain-containing protein [Lipomyces arxii]|uniref:Rapamycin-insensitive companion of mTOR, N-term-domain-containing protein n=1 Tax=Lipomyces arxii TaxID=56418 RepID=UPI0034CFE57D
MDMIKLEPINTDLSHVVMDDDDDGSPTYMLGDVLQSLEDPDRTPLFLVSKTNELVQLLQRYPALKRELVLPIFGRRIQKLLLHPTKEVVAAGYRAARYAISSTDSLKAIITLRTDAMVVKSLAKGAKCNVEREQAIKFVRAYMSVPNGVEELSMGVISALVAVASQPKDLLHYVALETLTELTLFAPYKISAAGGISLLSQALANGPYELAGSIAMTFMYLLDQPSTRIYLWSGHDLESVLAAFTELQERDHFDETKVKASAGVISVLLQTWTGLFYVCMYDLRALRSLIQCFRLQLPGLRDIMMNMIFDILRIRPLGWATSFLAGRSLTTYVSTAEDLPSRQEMNSKQRALSDHYTALLLAIFLEADVLAMIVLVIQENIDAKNTRKATLLLGEVISLASKILPQRLAQCTQVLDVLFQSAAQFGTYERFPSSSAIYEIDKITKNLYRSLPDLVVQLRGEYRRESRKPELKKMKISLHFDDNYFRNLLLDTNVLNTKNYTKWNWDALIELMQGPLLNPKRLDEAIRATKFMKRLMSFYRPFKYRFSEIKRTSTNARYIKAGSVLFKTLLANPEGVKYLMENKLLRQVAECLAQLDPMSGITSAEPLFSKQRLDSTLSYGYFTLLGTLTSDPNGLAMIERWRMFNMFYHLSELTSRKDLIFALISSLDYRLDGHTRVILSKILTTSDADVRLYATSHLGTLIDYDNVSLRNWVIELLVEQLYDVDFDVCELAIKVLGEICNDGPSLDYIVKRLSNLDHLSDITAPLLLRFLSTSEGFRFLQDLNYIEKEMDEWFAHGNDDYVQLVELELAKSYLIPAAGRNMERATAVPAHFYRELVRTNEGCKLLRQKDHLRYFVEYINTHADEQDDREVLKKLKGCIWAIGNIGSLEYGAPFLEDSNVTETIVHIANHSTVWSLRGTAFFALGLISSTVEGREITDEYGWETAVTVMGQPLGLCIPANLSQFLTVPEWNSVSLLRPSGRGIYVADSEAHLKKVVTAQTESSSPS